MKLAPTLPAARRNQRGSAYVIVLLVLVVLSILGLSLALVTQTERQIGSNEKTLQRLFYAAESGIGVAVSKALTLPDNQPFDLTLTEPLVGNVNLRHDVRLSALLPILDAPCNLCQINDPADFSEINHALGVTARRLGWTGSDPTATTLLSQKSINLMVEFQPWQGTPQQLSDSINNSAGIDRIVP
ncbi:MAG: PilX N-terminal domain-containing pilus assembly protein [Acidobacteriota bacterium]